MKAKPEGDEALDRSGRKETETRGRTGARARGRDKTELTSRNEGGNSGGTETGSI